MECQQCSKEFTPRQKTQKFCTKTCKIEYNKYTNNICEVCDKEYRGIKGRKYCSSECRVTTTREERCCKLCNDKFTERIKHDREFCSNDCRTNWMNIPENRGKQQNAIKETVKERYGVDHVWKVKDIHEKTMRNRDWSEIGSKVSESLLNKSESEWVSITEKRKTTKDEVYGDVNYNNPKKISETNLNKSDQERVEINQKRVNTMNSRYGVDSSLQLPHTRIRMGEVLFDIRDKITEKHRVRRELEVVGKLHTYKLKLKDKYITNKGNYEFQCLECDTVFNSWSMSWGNVPICRNCNPLIISNTQSIVEGMLNDLGVVFVRGDRTIIKPYEIDIYVPNHNLGIEINGNYFHSDIAGLKDRKYHINKTKSCNDKNIKLLHIFEDEVYKSPHIVKSKIENILGLCKEVIYARKCEIVVVEHSIKKKFLNENHLQGNSVDSVRLGLTYCGVLCSVMTFSKKRISTGLKHVDGEWELNRFCSVTGKTVVGGFSRLLNHFVKNHEPKHLTTYADIRWSGYNNETTVYSKNGFGFVSYTPPSYWYVSTKSYLNRLHRYTFRKSVLVNQGYDPNKTEWEIMRENGYDRIWDCGTMKFVMVP